MLYCVSAKLVFETVFDQMVVGWRYFSDPSVSEGHLLRIPVYWEYF